MNLLLLALFCLLYSLAESLLSSNSSVDLLVRDIQLEFRNLLDSDLLEESAEGGFEAELESDDPDNPDDLDLLDDLDEETGTAESIGDPIENPEQDEIAGNLRSTTGRLENDISCGKAIFEPDATLAAMKKGLSFVQFPNWKNKRREQPHYYNNYEGFDFPNCTEGRLYEFPILIGGRLHEGGRTGRPGAHRVIFKAERNGTYCGLITHEGADSWGGFVMCE